MFVFVDSRYSSDTLNNFFGLLRRVVMFAWQGVLGGG